MVISSRCALRFLHSSLTHFLTHYRKMPTHQLDEMG